jgi:hypothetical protein
VGGGAVGGGAVGGGAAEGPAALSAGPRLGCGGGGVPWVILGRGGGVAIAIVKSMFFMLPIEFFGLGVFRCAVMATTCRAAFPRSLLRNQERAEKRSASSRQTSKKDSYSCLA